MKVTTGLISDNCIEADAVSIEEFSITYGQPPDSNSSSDEWQSITITAQNGGFEEDDWYFSIKTDKWSVNDGKFLQELIEDFKKRMTIDTVKADSLKTIESSRQKI